MLLCCRPIVAPGRARPRTLSPSRTRSAVAKNARSVRDLDLRGHGTADAARDAAALLATVAGALPHAGDARRRPARRCPRVLGGPGLLRARPRPARRRPGDRPRSRRALSRKARGHRRAAGNRTLHRGRRRFDRLRSPAGGRRRQRDARPRAPARSRRHRHDRRQAAPARSRRRCGPGGGARRLQPGPHGSRRDHLHAAPAPLPGLPPVGDVPRPRPGTPGGAAPSTRPPLRPRAPGRRRLDRRR